jgi:hypothetical protein
MAKRIVAAVWAGAVAALLLLTPGGAGGGLAPALPIASNVAAHEPAGAAAFVRAIARGDEATAGAVASPLYRAERERRGLDPVARPPLQGTAASTIDLAFVGGARDDGGFGHNLYVATPARRGDPQPIAPSVWRVDTDPDGRVIWAELVWLFGAAGSVVPLDVSGEPTSASLPPAITALRPRRVLGVRSEEAREAYYLAVVTVAGEPRVVFFGEDQDGRLRPGAWSYGQANPGPSTYGRVPTPRPVTLAPELAALERAYVATLCGGC